MRIRIGSRIFIGMVAAVAAFLVMALLVVDRLVGQFLSEELVDDLARARSVVERFQGIEEGYLSGKARSLAQAPALGAALSAPAVDRAAAVRTASALREAAQVPLLLVVDRGGSLLVEGEGAGMADRPGMRSVLSGSEHFGIWELEDQVYRVAAIPVVVAGCVHGAVCVGYPLETTVAELHGSTGLDVAIVRDSEVLAAHWRRNGRSHGRRPLLDPLLSIQRACGPGVTRVRVGSASYLATAMPIAMEGASLILSRPLDQALARFRRAQQLLFACGAGILLIGLYVSRETSSRISRPIRELTRVSQAFAQGLLGTRVEAASDDELGTLASSFNEMADKIQERNAELSEARDRAEAASRAKSQFLANMSHELRTPLHGILSFSDFGIKRCAAAQPDKLRGYFERIHKSGQGLLVLLNDLLDLAKLEAGKMVFSFETCDLCAVVRSVIDEFSSRACEKSIQLSWQGASEHVLAVADPVRVAQVVRNLLSNAVRYSPESGVVDVSLERGAASALVSVRDRGPGIPEGELEDIFDEFVQSSATKTNAGGTGLGLSISRTIVAAHSGRIWARNNPDGGACFCFEIRLSGPEAAPCKLPQETLQGVA